MQTGDTFALPLRKIHRRPQLAAGIEVETEINALLFQFGENRKSMSAPGQTSRIGGACASDHSQVMERTELYRGSQIARTSLSGGGTVEKVWCADQIRPENEFVFPCVTKGKNDRQG